MRDDESTRDAGGPPAEGSPPPNSSVSRRRLLKLVGASGVAGTSALAGCSMIQGGTVGGRTETPEATNSSEQGESGTMNTVAPDEGRIGVGVFLGDEAALEPWEAWFGRPVDRYSFIVPTDGWRSYRIENMPFERPIRPIAADRDISISVRMFPPAATTMEAVAEGNHVRQHKTFARSLVDNDLGDATLRIGAELNGEWAADGAVGRPEMFIQSWKQMTGAMDAVDGAEFEYVWAPHIGRRDMDPTLAYPGDDWVDYIGLTVYDASQLYFPVECDETCVSTRREQTWEMLVTQEFGLDFWAQYARDHGKPLVFPEYGVVSRSWNDTGGGDNPRFFDWFAGWMAENSDVVGWHTAWCFVAGPHYVGPLDLHISGRYMPHPDASETYRAVFGPS
jgi:hypothetical protein